MYSLMVYKHNPTHDIYRKSRIFHVKNFLCDGQTTPYHISINNVHNLHVFNFHIAHAIRKYFNNKCFAIYGNVQALLTQLIYLDCMACIVVCEECICVM